jgi:hypothetical protein
MASGRKSQSQPQAEAQKIMALRHREGLSSSPAKGLKELWK